MRIGKCPGSPEPWIDLSARGDDPRQARHYASMVVDGADLHVLSRSGDHRARPAHDGNLITFHTIRNFRDLVYC